MSELKHVYISEIANYEGQDVCLKGWLYGKRSSGKLHFLQIRDGSGIIQAVIFKGDVSPETFEIGDKISQETSIEVYGTVKEDKRSAIGFEIGVKDIKVVGESHDYPITPKEHGVAFLMENRHLWLRSPRQHAIMKIRNEIINAVRNYFNNNGFYNYPFYEKS